MGSPADIQAIAEARGSAGVGDVSGVQYGDWNGCVRNGWRGGTNLEHDKGATTQGMGDWSSDGWEEERSTRIALSPVKPEHAASRLGLSPRGRCTANGQ